MISIAIYSDLEEHINELKSLIQDYSIENKVMAKISIFNDNYNFITVPNRFDIYIMDMESKDDVIALGKQRMGIDDNGHFIYLSNDTTKAYSATKIRADYFIAKPIDKEEFVDVLKEIRQEVQDDTIVIKIASGERRVRANMLNYVNIEKRCLCYHLKDGSMFDGQTLRSSFEKAIFPLQHDKAKSFLFLPPSLLINIGEVKIVNSDNVVFENDDVLFVPKKAYDTIRNAWINYNKFVNL